MSERSIESYGKIDVFDSDDSTDGWQSSQYGSGNVGVMILDLF